MLEVINASPGDLGKSFDAIVDRATRLCNATGGGLWLVEGETARAAGVSGLPEPFVDLARRTPARLIDLLGRNPQEQVFFHVEDLRASKAYLGGSPFIVASAEVGKIRTFLGVPLKDAGAVVGVFTLVRDHVRQFEPQIALVLAFAAQALIAMKNARLFNETKEALERQTATAEILQAIAGSPTDVQPVLEAIAASANRLLGGLSTAVWRFHQDHGRPVAFTPTNPEGDAALQALSPLPKARSPFLSDLNEGKVRQLPDTEHAQPNLREVARRRGFRSMLFVPLMAAENAIGFVSVTRKDVGAFDPDDVELLRTFADQAMIAIENAHLFDEVRARTRDLTEALQQQAATANVLKVISRSAVDLQSVLNTLVRSAVELGGAPYGAIHIREGDGYHFRGSFGTSQEMIKFMRGRPFVAGRGSVVGRVALSGKVEAIPDVLTDPDFHVPVHRVNQTRSVLGVPLLRDNRVEGVLILARSSPGDFSPRLIELVKTFADQAVIAIENVRLFEEAQARTRDLTEALQQQTAIADVLKVISRSAFDLDTVFQTLVTTAVNLCKASSGTLCVRDGDVFNYRGMAGPEATQALQRYLEDHPLVTPTRGTIAGRAILSQQIERIADVLRDEDYEVPFSANGNPARSLLGVPLLGKAGALDAIVVARVEAGDFPQRHVEILKTFADQAVIAIENARLFDEVQARTRELSQSLADLQKRQDRLVQMEKLASLGQLTAGIAHEIKKLAQFRQQFRDALA